MIPDGFHSGGDFYTMAPLIGSVVTNILHNMLPPPLNPANSVNQPHIILCTVTTRKTTILTLRMIWERNGLSRNRCKQ